MSYRIAVSVSVSVLHSFSVLAEISVDVVVGKLHPNSFATLSSCPEPKIAFLGFLILFGEYYKPA